MGGNPDLVAADPTGHGGHDPTRPPRPDDPNRPPGKGERHVATGRITELFYDCFGVFEGFVLEDCETRHRFRSCEPGIERMVHRACRHRSKVSVVSVVVNGKRELAANPRTVPASTNESIRSALKPLASERRIVKLILHCCG